MKSRSMPRGSPGQNACNFKEIQCNSKGYPLQNRSKSDETQITSKGYPKTTPIERDPMGSYGLPLDKMLQVRRNPSNLKLVPANVQRAANRKPGFRSRASHRTKNADHIPLCRSFCLQKTCRFKYLLSYEILWKLSTPIDHYFPIMLIMH